MFDVKLLDKDAYHAILLNNCYDLIPKNILFPMVQTIIAVRAGDPSLSEMGTYQMGNDNTEAVQFRRLITIPFAYVPVFLANKVTPCLYFEILYPQIVTNNRDMDCTEIH